MSKSKRQYENTEPHLRTKYPHTKHLYMGNLTLSEFDLIDLQMVSCEAVTPFLIQDRMSVSSQTANRQITRMKGVGLLEKVFDGALGSIEGDAESNGWGGNGAREKSGRKVRSPVQDRLLPTTYAYDQWHLALGEDPDDARHQYAYGRLEALRGLWKARNDEALRKRATTSRP